MAKNVLNIKDVTFSFSQEKLLNEISFNVVEGEIIALIGRSGSGKTTLLNIISSLQKNITGTVLFDDIPLDKPTNKISYLGQNPLLLYYKTAIENALLGIELRKNITKNIVDETLDLFRLFNINNDLNKFPHELSGGMKQRIGIIQSLIINAKLYLLDEPFTAIDHTTVLIIEDYIWRRFKEKRSSAILITHDLEQALAISDRIILLSNLSKDIYYELKTPKSFSLLSPSSRRLSTEFSKTLYELLKKFGEL